MAGASVTINHAKLKRYAERVARQAALRAAETTRERARENVWRTGRVRTTALANSFKIEPTVGRGTNGAWFRVYTDIPYAMFQEKGTRGSKARKGGALRFQSGGQILFRKSTGPISPANFMRDAARSLRASDFAP